jgi:hypothetical protein
MVKSPFRRENFKTMPSSPQGFPEYHHRRIKKIDEEIVFILSLRRLYKDLMADCRCLFHFFW